MTLAGLLAAVVCAAASLLLGLAGAAKLRHPAAATTALRAAGFPSPGSLVRLLAAGELAVAAAGLILAGPWNAGLLGVVYAGLSLGAVRAAWSGAGVACGCFGARDGAPLGRRHVLIDLSIAVAAGLAAGAGGPAVTGHDLPHVLGVLAAGGLLALVLRAALEARRRPRPISGGGWRGGDTLLSLADRAAGGLERLAARRVGGADGHGVTRRSALVRLAVAGSALSIAPLRYLLYPGSALAVVAPGGCAGGLCDDGYTAFCCEINDGLNECPADTFVGGWWMCTDYQGHQLCAGEGVRYYVDCNAIPGRPFPGGCRCANDSCESRRINCNVFRYGQCNTEVAGVTPVVCRRVTCESPADIPQLNCSAALMVDDAVCGHEAGCLEPPAVQLAGAGGA
jgi:hypothetical protein